MAKRNVCVIGVGMTKFERCERDFTDLVREAVSGALQIVGGREQREEEGTRREEFARGSAKTHRHSVNNPRSQYQAACSLEEVLAARMVYDPLTILQCCPTSDGAGAAILCSEEFAKKQGVSRPVKIVAQAMATDKMEDFAMGPLGLIGVGMSERAAKAVYEQAGLGPKDVQVIELHDCFSTNELVTYESLGLCEEGQGGGLIDEDQVTYGGKWVVNPSGGLLSKGHPPGATRLAPGAELAWQLTGKTDKGQG